MDDVINVGMNRINKTPAAVKVTANGSLKGNRYPGSLLHYYLYVHKRNRES